MTSKAVERAVALLEVLSTRRFGLDRNKIRERIPGYALAKTDGAFERMFERDKEVLRALGIELVAERATHSQVGFVYRVQRPSRTVAFSPLDFVLLSHLASAWEGTELERMTRSALLKIGAQTGQKLSSNLGDSAKFSDVVGLAECIEATADGKGLSFTYTNDTVRKITCWGLGLRFGHWYVYGWDRDKRAERIFRLDRMVGIKIIPATAKTAPEGFKMVSALERIGDGDLTYVASRTLVGPQAGKTRLLPSYSVRQSAIDALTHESTHRVEHLPGSANRLQQEAVIEREDFIRAKLLRGHLDEAETESAPLEWKTLLPQRARESASEQLIRTVLMLTLVSDAGEMSLGEIADFFDLSVAKVRGDLEDVAASLDFGALSIDIDPQNLVRVKGGAALTGGSALTAAEAAALILAVELSDAGESHMLTDRLVLKLGQTVPGAPTVHNKFAVYSHEVNGVLREAIENNKPLQLRYSSYTGVSERVVEPVSLVINDGPRYLYAWCRKAEGFRNFRIDRMSNIRLLEDETFEPHQTQEIVTPHRWHKSLNAEQAEVATVSVARTSDASSRSAELLIERYALAVAETAQRRFFQVPVVHRSWLFEILIAAEGQALLVAPRQLRDELLDFLGANPISAKK